MSSTLPNRKSVGKNLKAKRVLRYPLRKLHKLYSQEASPDRQCQLTSFMKYRPRHILCATSVHLTQCLCEYCANLDLIVTVLRAFCKTNDIELSDEAITEASLCRKNRNKWHKRACLSRQCQKCGVEQILGPLREKIQQIEGQLHWQKWISVGRKKLLTEMEGTPVQLLEEIAIQLEPHPMHLFNAEWQYDQFISLKACLPKGWILLILDFAENYRTFYQNEVQSAHWSYNQITIHPIVAFYKCPTCEGLVQEALVFLTDDLCHDVEAVDCFTDKTINFLKQERKIDIKHMVQFTDGCSSQYKSKTPFHHISQMQLSTERGFFGSRHGKGPSDGISAIVKQSCYRAVKSSTATIQCAKDMYNFLCQEMPLERPTCRNHPSKCTPDHASNCTPDKCYRKYFLITDIPRNDADTDLLTIKGTRKVHSVRNCGSPGSIRIRNLSCFCPSCLEDTGNTKCENSNYVDSWKEQGVLKRKHASGNK